MVGTPSRNVTARMSRPCSRRPASSSLARRKRSSGDCRRGFGACWPTRDLSPAVGAAAAGRSSNLKPRQSAGLERPRNIADRVRARRHELGWSQEQLAFKASINQTYIASLETGAGIRAWTQSRGLLRR